MYFSFANHRIQGNMFENTVYVIFHMFEMERRKDATYLAIDTKAIKVATILYHEN